MSKGYSIIFLLLALTQISISATPFIAEYIIPFDIPVNDLYQAVSNQLSRNDFKTNSFSSDNVTVSHLIYQSHYNDQNRSIIPPYHPSYPEHSHHTMTYHSTASISQSPTRPACIRSQQLRKHSMVQQRLKSMRIIPK